MISNAFARDPPRKGPLSMEQDQPVYFDYAATTPVRPEAMDAMVRALGSFGNPSSR